MSQLIGSIVNEMMMVHRQHIELFFLRPLLGPLYKCLDDSAVEGKDHVIVREEELSTCLEDMQKVRWQETAFTLSVFSPCQILRFVRDTQYCLTFSDELLTNVLQVFAPWISRPSQRKRRKIGFNFCCLFLTLQCTVDVPFQFIV